MATNNIKHGYKVENLSQPKMGDLLLHERYDQTYYIAKITYCRGWGKQVDYFVEITRSTMPNHPVGHRQWFEERTLIYNFQKLSIFNYNKVWYEVINAQV